VNRGRQRAVRGTEGGGGGGQGGEGDDGGLNDGGMKGSGGQQVLEEAAVAVATQLSRRPDSANRGGRGGVEDRRGGSEPGKEGCVMRTAWPCVCVCVCCEETSICSSTSVLSLFFSIALLSHIVRSFTMTTSQSDMTASLSVGLQRDEEETSPRFK